MEKGFLNSSSASKGSKLVGNSGAHGSNASSVKNMGSSASLADQSCHNNVILTSLADQTRTGGSHAGDATKSVENTADFVIETQ